MGFVRTPTAQGFPAGASGQTRMADRPWMLESALRASVLPCHPTNRAGPGSRACAMAANPNRVEEIEVRVSMLDKDDGLMKICLGTMPGERGPNRTGKARLRRGMA